MSEEWLRWEDTLPEVGSTIEITYKYSTGRTDDWRLTGVVLPCKSLHASPTISITMKEGFEEDEDTVSVIGAETDMAIDEVYRIVAPTLPKNAKQLLQMVKSS